MGTGDTDWLAHFADEENNPEELASLEQRARGAAVRDVVNWQFAESSSHGNDD